MNTSGVTFYCFECRKASNLIVNGLYCCYCGHKLFNDFEELEEYLSEEEEVLGKEPFSKPRRFKKEQE